MLLFARTEARVMRGIVKGAISIYSPDGKLSQLGKEMRVADRAEALVEPAPSKNYFHG
jgi:hypothetical protein